MSRSGVSVCVSTLIVAFKIRATASVCSEVSDAAWMAEAIAMALLRATRLFVLLVAAMLASMANALDKTGDDAVEVALRIEMRLRATLISVAEVVLSAEAVPTKQIRFPRTSVEVEDTAVAVANNIMSVAITVADVSLDVLIVAESCREIARTEFVFVELLALIVALIRYATPSAALLVVVAFAVITETKAFAMLTSTSDGVELAAAIAALKASISFSAVWPVAVFALIVATSSLMIEMVGVLVVIAAFTVATILRATESTSLDVDAAPVSVAMIERATVKIAEF